MGNGVRGQFGIVGRESLTKLYPDATGTQAISPSIQGLLGPSTDVVISCNLHIRAEFQPSIYYVDIGANAGLIGEFAMVGSLVTGRLFGNRSTALHFTRSIRPQAYLYATDTDDQTLLTLDWVQHGNPFAWAYMAAPGGLTLDWVHSANPFATNSYETESVPIASAFRIIADFPAVSLEESDITISGVFEIIADLTVAERDRVLIQGDFNIHADIRFNATLYTFIEGEYEIVAGLEVESTMAISLNVQMLIRAELSTIGEKRPVKPCEYPTAVLNLTSNLPYGIWQNNPLAIFSWSPVVTCDKVDGYKAVDGYLWKLSTIKPAAAAYDWNQTSLTTEEEDLSDNPPYGSGAYWFSVAAVNDVSIGPMAQYYVKYNNPPSQPGVEGMWINELDTLYQCPLIAYDPPEPHQFTWSDVTDLDSDILTYELEVWTNPDFVLDLNSQMGLVFFADNLPDESCPLSETLNPGHYFWRIRANDGKEFSEWSPTGVFQVNHPPERPWELGVEQVT